ncbi:hypothetical protein [Methylobacterium sp. Leaf118]|uniref:hypothetical protein n=1 Tax=Methylobacterium sp. Leaf118 TaxID=2876562 RepID=UPI001E604BF8|nr:hypothetical protein [Methylobacterium sp. Leaf118]
MILHLPGLSNDDFVALVRKEVASAGLCGFDSLDDARNLLAEAATRIEEVRATLRREIGYKVVAQRDAANAERDVIETLRAKADGQMAYWRHRMAAEKSPDDGISEDGETYTPIGDEAAWSGGYCNGRLGEAEWWQSTLKHMAPASATEAQRAETGTGSVHEGAVGTAETPDPLPHPLPAEQEA